MNRRTFALTSLGFAVTTAASKSTISIAQARETQSPEFSTQDTEWQAAYDKALAVLRSNVQMLPRFDRPVLIEGAEYPGVWQECGPLEALAYRKFRPDVARNGHMVFFKLQREDGQLPASNKRSEAGYGQIQMVVPIAATAWELAQATKDEELLDLAYRACARWDAWLMRYRNTRSTGLIEGFCTYDTGMDNSPRWEGMPNRCSDADAKKCAPVRGLPRLSPDLSATVYGARIALAAMANALGKSSEADHWTGQAESIRKLILTKLYVPDDAAFYDLDAEGQFVKVRTCAIARICGEHVVDQKIFDDLWTRQLHNPKAFWAAYPLPSVALDDPKFVRPIPRNSWGGASQALTALRAGRWFDFYGRSAELSTMMNRWCEAILRDSSFRQQIDPETGIFTPGGSPGYSPAALVMLDYTWRLAGIYETHDEIHWNIRPEHRSSNLARFRMSTDEGRTAELHYDKSGATLRLAGKELGRIEGGAARLITDKIGTPKRLVGISEDLQRLLLRHSGRKHRFKLLPNQSLNLAGEFV